jgi:hypothetical protein
VSRSAYPTGGARTPRLRMAAKDAIALYRLERESWRARVAEIVEAEREALARLMHDAWVAGRKEPPKPAAIPEPHVCMCGCGQRCEGTRRTASEECLRRVKVESNRRQVRKPKGVAHVALIGICEACRRTFRRGKMPNQRFCQTVPCQKRRQALKRQRREARQARSNTIADPRVTIHTAPATPNEVAA